MAQETNVDVLICGSGSAGLCAAVWLARAGINFRILESRDGPLQLGQADGVQARTVEIFESFGLERPLLDESYHVLELAFWSRGDGGGIQRSRYAPDLMPGLSHQPHVILNQARVNMLMIEDIRTSLGGNDNIEYEQKVQNVTVDEAAVGDSDAYCTTVTSVKNGQEHIFRAKYVLGCDGAHSIVRKSLGIKMEGDSTDSKWGVMDVYVRTDFPDIRKKSVISSSHGNLLIIPREGDFLVRFYLELHDAGDKQIPFEKLVEQASRIFHPYTLEVVETVWWSTYSIGQRLADSFSVSDRVFLTGDACHTHSPKAGQGMNVSLQDGHNLGWKLAAVLNGQASPSILATYVLERQKTAAELIDFDRKFTKLFSSTYREANGISADDFESAFIEAGRFTAGQATKYPESPLTRAEALLNLETSVLKLGMRFPTAHVVRQSDARSMQLVRAMPADGRWHIVIFGGTICDEPSSARLDKVAKHLDALVRHFTPVGADADSVFNILLVLAGRRHDLGPNGIHDVFAPSTGKWKIKNLHKVFFDDESYDQGHGQAYQSFEIDSRTGCAVIIRPDQYIAKISSLDQVDAFQYFFAGFMSSTSRLKL